MLALLPEITLEGILDALSSDADPVVTVVWCDVVGLVEETTSDVFWVDGFSTLDALGDDGAKDSVVGEFWDAEGIEDFGSTEELASAELDLVADEDVDVDEAVALEEVEVEVVKVDEDDEEDVALEDEVLVVDESEVEGSALVAEALPKDANGFESTDFPLWSSLKSVFAVSSLPLMDPPSDLMDCQVPSLLEYEYDLPVE